MDWIWWAKAVAIGKTAQYTLYYLFYRLYRDRRFRKGEAVLYCDFDGKWKEAEVVRSGFIKRGYVLRKDECKFFIKSKKIEPLREKTSLGYEEGLMF